MVCFIKGNKINKIRFLYEKTMDVKSGPDIIGRLRFLLCLGANLVIYYDVICLDSILSKPTSTPGIRVFSIQYAQLNFIYCNMFYYLLGRIFQL